MLSLGYLAALALTLAVEVPIVAACYPGQRLHMACVAALITASTHLAMHTLLPLAVSDFASFLLIGEAMATLVEAGVYAVASRPPELGRGLVASAVANSASYAVGLLFW